MAILGREVRTPKLRDECPDIRWTVEGIHECY